MITHSQRKIIVDSFCDAFPQEYKIYCSDIYPGYLVPLYLLTFVAIPDYICVDIPRYPKIIFLRQKEGRPSYDGKQSFYSILSSHWEMGWPQLSITTLHCTHLPCFFTIYKMHFSDSVKCISHLHCTALTFVVSSKFTPNSS